ncbi:MAG: anhydro-N-acetylmuramic acid kinase [Bacteroidales bacterium]|nr:anhydro-N-acetylmuramic acid kinase [Bacteroidales bacterium]MCF8404251.1 anhydro-N-acetylmuramic acid kinase [Bacteroidales bacterium]
MEIYKVIGVMSGTSLDGLDIAYCLLIYDKTWAFHIEKTKTIEYSEYWKNKFKSLIKGSSHELVLAHKEFGSYIGKQVAVFCSENKIIPDLIASHGHTIFHQPEKRLTFQLGDGNAIFSQTDIPVVYDFRTLDIALGGQGAPLVPIGDRLLFGQYDFCLNLGGFSNVSYEDNDVRVAFDICPVNIVLNQLSLTLNKPFDDGGHFAEAGKVNKGLLQNLNELEYYKLSHPKSLGREWVEKMVFPLFDKYNIETIDILSTFTDHIAIQISNILNSKPESSVIITGGGAYNRFLVKRIKEISLCKIHIPDQILIEFKEALVFAFLGVLKIRNEVNCLSSVTGARRDSSSGIVVS